MSGRLSYWRWMLSAGLLLILGLGACGGGEADSFMEELDQIDIQENEALPPEQEEGIDADAPPSEVQYAFTLDIHRLGHITDPGVNTVLEETATVEIWGQGDLYTGQVIASGTMTNLLGQPCEMRCEYELEFVVNGYINAPPTCEFIMTILTSPGPGTCTSDCPTVGFTVPFYGITDTTPEEVTFYPDEIGFRTIDVERVAQTTELGNLHWLNTFSISGFTGSPVVAGCEFEF